MPRLICAPEGRVRPCKTPHPIIMIQGSRCLRLQIRPLYIYMHAYTCSDHGHAIHHHTYRCVCLHVKHVHIDNVWHTCTYTQVCVHACLHVYTYDHWELFCMCLYTCRAHLSSCFCAHLLICICTHVSTTCESFGPTPIYAVEHMTLEVVNYVYALTNRSH